MKSLGFDHNQIPRIRAGAKTSTWRLNDDKDLSVNDKFEVIDKVDPDKPKSWQIIGEGTIDQITQKRIGEINPQDTGGHEAYRSVEEMYAAMRQHYGDAVDDPFARIKIIDFTFMPYDMPKPLSEAEAQTREHIEEVKLYADGGSRGNPGPASSGYALLDMDDNIITKHGIYIGVTTNNQAEYRALKIGLEEAQKRGVQRVHVFMDSLLVVNQMLGKFKVRNADLWPVHDSIKNLVPQFEEVTFTHVPRELNKLADSMVNQALDAQKQSS